MRGYLLVIWFLFSLTACNDNIITLFDLGGTCSRQDGSIMRDDMQTSTPRCAAGQFLPGEAVVCEDFTNKQTALSIDALVAKGWDFLGNPNCWQTSNGFLEVKAFQSFVGNCSFAPKTLDFRTEFQKYQRVTLSIIHRVDLSAPEHQARIYIKDDGDSANQLYFNTNKLTALRQQMTFTLQRNDLANPNLNDVFKFVMKINSIAGVATRQGWQFESIAVFAHP
ncbi:MAG: hypothetical protein U1A78_31040 [Polyangia bacterium]